jgi:hypothetical protein
VSDPAPAPRRRIRPLRAQYAAPAAEINVEPPDEWAEDFDDLPPEPQAPTSAVSAEPAPAASAPSAPAPTPAPTDGDSTEDRYKRLSDGTRKLRVGTGALHLNERTLMILGSILAVIGLGAIFVGWYGASHSPFLFQQVPYLISGGLFGLGLVFLGSIFYFSHWLTELVREGRTQSAALVDAITRLEDTIRQQSGEERSLLVDAITSSDGPSDGHANGSAHSDLVATGKGTMAHRPDCVVVAGKHGLRRVGPDDGLEPCKLCDPFSEVARR